MRPPSLAIVVLLLLSNAGGAADDLRPSSFETVPPEWLQINVDWKPTWEETLTANPEAKWNEAIGKDLKLAAARDLILRLRRIELLKAMIARFPNDRAKHLLAYEQIAQFYQQAGSQDWRAYWGWKMVQDFPGNADAMNKGYALMLGWGFGQYTHWGEWAYWTAPDCRKWEFAIHEVIAKHAEGKLKTDSPAVSMAYQHLLWLHTDFLQYDKFHATLDRLDQLGAQSPGLRTMAGQFLQVFGHRRQAAEFMRKAGDLAAGNQLQGYPDGAIEGVRPDFEMTTRWEAISKIGCLSPTHQGPLDPEEIQNLLDCVARRDAHFRDGSRYVPFWAAVDARLRQLPPERLASLREAQNKAARTLAEKIQASGDSGALLSAFRQYPFAQCLHELMIDLSERDLTRGHSNWAIPIYRDVLAHAVDPTVRRQAQTGLWLALANSGVDRPALEAAMATVGAAEPLPWRGQTIPAGELKRQLLGQIAKTEPKRTSAVKLADLPMRHVALPPSWPNREDCFDGTIGDYGTRSPWPVSRVELRGKATLVTAPTAVARFASGSSDPTWVCAPPDTAFDENPPWDEASGRHFSGAPLDSLKTIPRPVRVAAATAEGEDPEAFYCLMNNTMPPTVAAIDSRHGQIRWTTAGKEEWDRLMPLTQPVISEGRIYVLAGPTNLPRQALILESPPAIPVVQHLVCLDADSGRMLWKRAIGWLPFTFFDLARGGGAVTVHQGSVYCATNMGIVARLSAHDGMIQWLHGYPIACQHPNPLSLNRSREGAGPMLVGDMLLVAPRDHTGIFAFRRETGELVWEAILVPSDKLVGVAGRVVVGVNSQWIGGLDLATGRRLWIREFAAGTSSQAAVVGPDIVVVSAGRAYRLEAATGKTLEELELKAPKDSDVVIGLDGTLIHVTPPRLASAPGPSTTGRPLTLPLKQVWSVPCQSPKVRLDVDKENATVALASGRRIGVVTNRPQWQVAWEHLLPKRPQMLALVDDHVITSQRRQVTSYHRKTGEVRWSTEMPMYPSTFGGDDKTLHAGAGLTNGCWPFLAGVNGTDGKVLWSRPLGGELRIGGFLAAMAFDRRKDGTPVVRATVSINYADTGGRFGEVYFNGQTGKYEKMRPLLPPGQWVWGDFTADEDGIGWLDSNTRKIKAIGWDHDGDLTAGWTRELDLMRKLRWHFRRMGVHARDGGVYARLVGELVFFNPATRRETVFDLKKPQADAIQPFIFAFRKVRDRLIMVWGDTSQFEPLANHHSPAPTEPVHWKMYVGVFDYATGRRIEQQELPGVKCCVNLIAYQTMAGYDTQAWILDDAIVISDTDGLHVFASSAGPAPKK